MYSVVSRKKQVEDLDRQQQGLVFVQSKLTKGMPSGGGTELDRFRYVVSQAECMQGVLLDADEDNSNSWTSQSGGSLAAQVQSATLFNPAAAIVDVVSHALTPSMEVRQMLEGFLPKPIMSLIASGAVTDLQNIMDDRNVGVNNFVDLFGGTESADKSFQEFGFVRIPDWAVPKFELYYVRLEAHFESARILWVHEDKNTLRAEYKMKRYAVSPGVLRDVVSHNPIQARRSIQEWLEKSITC